MVWISPFHHGDGTIKARVARPIYLAHAPGTDQGENLIRAKARTRLQGHLLPRIMT